MIFFAVSTTFLESSGLKLDLPRSSSTAEREARELTVGLASDGSLEFEGESVRPQDLEGLLREKLAERTRKVVVLRADQETPHREVVRVMDLIRTSGAEALTIAARPSSD